MPTMTETEDRLRDTLTAVASSVRDSDQATLDSAGPALPMATPPPPRRAGAARRRPLLVFAASFIGVLLVGAVSVLTGGTGNDSDATGVSSQNKETPVESGLGMNGSHFAVSDRAWTLAEAWETSEGGPGTYSIYQHGNEQVIVLTGSATTHVSEFPGEGSETTLTVNSNQVTERSASEGEDVTFYWTTSDGMPVSVNFTGMDRDRALQVATTLEPIESEVWDELLQTARAEVEARTGESGTGGEEGTGEWIRLDSPDAPEVILELAEGIELPPGHTFDRVIENLPEEPTEQTEQGIRSMLEFEAGCIWTGYWLNAVEADDTAARDQALAVLDEIPTWPALNATDGGGAADAWTRNAELAAEGDVQGVLDNLYTANCTDTVPGQ